MGSALARLSGVDLVILEAIHYWTEKTGIAYPGRAWLAQRAGCSIRTISRHVTKLKRMGYLTARQRRYRRRDGTWDTRSNVYRILRTVGERVGELIRSIFTGGTRLAPTPQRKEKSMLRRGDFFPLSDADRPSEAAIRKIPLLRAWWERGMS